MFAYIDIYIYICLLACGRIVLCRIDCLSVGMVGVLAVLMYVCLGHRRTR